MRRLAIAGGAALALGAAFWTVSSQPESVSVPGDCPAGALGARLGVEHLLFGAQVSYETARSTPLAARYRYLTGPVPAPGCDSCQSCEIEGVSCQNPDGCGWWGCWQDDSLPPGQIARDFVGGPQEVSMLTYYAWLPISGGEEGPPELAALSDGERVAMWLADFRFLAETIAGSGPVIVHVEPDLLGFLHKANDDPTAVDVNLAGVDECSDLSPNAASLIPCWRRILSTHAPDALLGIHVSAWAAGADVMRSPRRLDVQSNATQTLIYLEAAGLDADVLVVETSDRDAGFDGDAWPATGEPSLSRAVEWAGSLTKRSGIPHLWWQVPMGTPDLDNACGRYVDDRVHQFVSHADTVAQAGAIGVLFGAGTECMTTAESDDGAFLAGIAPALAGPPLLCGAPQ